MIPDYLVNTFPHYGGNGCQDIGIVPTDVRQGITNEIPNGFNPLPSTYSTTSHSDAKTYGGLWQNATVVGNGWDYLSWFGSFNTSFSPWIYHSTLGWLYPYGTFTDSVWFYDQAMGAFWWTNQATYPYVYRASDGVWLYYQVGSSNPRLFYNFKTNQWESH